MSTDPWGDTATLSADGMSVSIVGDDSPDGLGSGVIISDFGTDTLEFGTGASPYPNLVNGKLSPECQKALQDLNLAFATFIPAAFGFGASGPKGARAFRISGSIGGASTAIGLMIALDVSWEDVLNKQDIVDNACRGQGAGRYPYG